MLNTINLLEKLEKKNFQINKFWINNSHILKLANNSYIIRINIWKKGKMSCTQNLVSKNLGAVFHIIYSIF
ncbi:hypothetical protein RN96_09785 [Fusobacterium polymorphum]|uniref:Uncharacterized protein n=1 Tax=Fusobacterium nucleatum subsp. polymorphum TaxID=76857 RepID=A0A2B7YH19_FUSNP|nr:hypothetical protein RN96_09785 [Fusobacterium polymorphum]